MQNPYQPPGAPPPGWAAPPPPVWPPAGAPLGGNVPFGSAPSYPMSPEQREQARLKTLETEAQDQATAGLIAACVGLFCFLGVIGGPVAIYRGNKSLRLIREHGVGSQHATKAQLAIGLGLLSVLAFFAGLGFMIYIGATR